MEEELDDWVVMMRSEKAFGTSLGRYAKEKALHKRHP